MAAIVTISGEKDLNDVISKNDRKLVAIYFEASFAAECASMNPILEQYQKDVDFSNVVIARVDAEKFEDVANKYSVAVVPGFVFVKSGKVIDALQGFNPPQLNRLLKKCLDVNVLPSVEVPTSNGSGSLDDRLNKLINQSKIMLFMKGSPDAPRCGFSRQIIGILGEVGASFGYFDILQDETVRQGLKEYSKWPTYPQLYVSGELIGGLDIIKELKASGELAATLQPEA